MVLASLAICSDSKYNRFRFSCCLRTTFWGRICAHDLRAGELQRCIDCAGSIGLCAFMMSTVFLLGYILLAKVVRCLRLASEGGGIDDESEGLSALVGELLPRGAVAGVLCATGQACWLVANETLRTTTAATLLGALAALIDTLLPRNQRHMELRQAGSRSNCHSDWGHPDRTVKVIMQHLVS